MINFSFVSQRFSLQKQYILDYPRMLGRALPNRPRRKNMLLQTILDSQGKI
jgi:hypothetical protein